MNRRQTTKFLSELLINKRLLGMGKHYASEVTLDWGKRNKTKRVDFMQFIPQNQYSVSGIEAGKFICYEIKSCKSDFNSGNGLNFVGDKNYIVTTMKTYKEIIKDIPYDVGVMVACPKFRDITDEFEHPTPLEDNEIWDIKIAKNSMLKGRERSITELLFCMLRSGR